MGAWTDSALRLASRVTLTASGPVTLLGVNGWPERAIAKDAEEGRVAEAPVLVPPMAAGAVRPGRPTPCSRGTSGSFRLWK